MIAIPPPTAICAASPSMNSLLSPLTCRLLSVAWSSRYLRPRSVTSRTESECANTDTYWVSATSCAAKCSAASEIAVDDAAVAVQIGDAAVRGDDGGLLNVGDRVVHAAAETAVDMEFTRPMPPAHFECGKHVGVVLLGREPECAHTGIAGGFRREILGGIEVADDHVDMHAEFARMGIAAVRRHDERMLWQRIWARVILAGAEKRRRFGMRCSW